MKKTLILIFIALLLFACDRFEHKFEVEEDVLPVGPWFAQFQNTLENVTASSLQDVMDYYDDEYSNDGLNKNDLEILFNSFIEDELIISATLIDTTNMPNIRWHLMAENSDREVVYEEDINDVLVIKEDSYLWFGDQADKTNIIIELFTGTWCTFCPYAEEALYELKEQYGSRLSYVEYHIGDPLDNDFGVLLNYYPNEGSLPLTIINGNAAILSNADEDTQDVIEDILQPLLNEPLYVVFSAASAVISDNNLNGSVTVDIDESISLDDLKLVLVLQDDLNTDETNYNGDYLHNTALKRSVIDITECSQVVDFTITELDDLAGYDALPEDLTLLIWLQTLESTYSQSTCRAYNVIEVPVAQNEN